MAAWIENLNCITFGNMILSPLAMAEWIEINVTGIHSPPYLSPLAMAEWIEILNCFNFGTMILSPLAMAEWIEIFLGRFPT